MYFRITIPALQDGKKDEAVSFVKENVMTSFDDTPGLLSMTAAITGKPHLLIWLPGKVKRL